MRHDSNIHRIGSEIAALEPFVEAWPTRVQGECPVLGRLSRAIFRLRASVKQAIARRRTEAELAELDDRLLRDIGLSRAEASGWGPPRARIRPFARHSHDHV
jgi:uncharacterized protein YjiS (DUF1127 family)